MAWVSTSPHFWARVRALALGVPAILLGAPVASSHAAPPTGKAAPSASGAAATAEFEVVPASDELYRLLGRVRRGGLAKSAPTQNSTRYEMALETGRATLALSSRRAAGTPVPDDATAALSELLTRLRPELRRLDVDVDAALLLCRPPSARVGAGKAKAEVSASDLLQLTPRTVASRAPGSSAGALSSGLGLSQEARATMSLSQRLRVSAAISSLERDARDPYGDAASGNSALASSSRGAGRARAGSSVVAGAQVDVTQWLRLNADYAATTASAPATGTAQALRAGSPDAALLAPGGASRSMGAGLEVSPLSGLTLSGGVARLGQEGGVQGTRSAVGARISGFNNRLSLSANLSRLTPEDAPELSRSAAALGLGVGSDRFKLIAVYQQLFGAPASGQSGRVIAGGVNISF